MILLRIRSAAISAILLVLACGANGQEPSKPASTEDDPAPPAFVLDVKDQAAKGIFEDLEKKTGTSIQVIGDAQAPITLSLASNSLEAVVRAVATRAGFLATRKGDIYVVYAGNAEAQVGNTVISLNHKLRGMTPDLALTQLNSRGFGDLKFQSVPHLNSILFTGTLPLIRQAVDYLNTIDEISPMVSLELLVVEYIHGNSYSWGFNLTEGTNAKLSKFSYDPGSRLSNLGFTYNFVDRLSPSFKLNLNALVEEDSAKVVTNPHIAVRHGEEGLIKLAEELHIVLSNPGSNFGNLLSLQTLEAGVTLRIAPKVVSEKVILLDLTGEVAVFVPAGKDQFSIDRSTLTSKVNVADQQTLIIGGLIKGSNEGLESGVPFLRRLPLLGYLFRNKTYDRRYIETVMYITPHIGEGSYYTERSMQKEIEQRMKALDSKHEDRKSKQGRRP